MRLNGRVSSWLGSMTKVTTLSRQPCRQPPVPISSLSERNSKRRFSYSSTKTMTQLVLICLFEGVVKPAEIAEETGLGVEDVYRIKQKIKRRLSHLREERSYVRRRLEDRVLLTAS